MSDSSRFAIYLAPKPETALWQFGSSVLGYDAQSGLEIAGFRLPSMGEPQWKNATARARTYGFHATLKAPFRLAAQYSEQDLLSGLKAFAATQSALSKMVLQLSILDENEAGGFLGLTPASPNPALHRLEDATVKHIDRFRAALTSSEIEKRNSETLTIRQKTYLSEHGYPYVLEEFRAHFTLSDRLTNAKKAALELNDLMNGHVGAVSIEIDELVLFKQPNASARFGIIARAPLGDKY